MCVQITELEAQCNEADQEKQKNAQLSVRVQELEAEINEKQQVRRENSHCQTQREKKDGMREFLKFLQLSFFS